jgi:hypothetical protein
VSTALTPRSPNALDLGDVAQCHRRIMPPDRRAAHRLSPQKGTLLPGASADQIVLPDRVALGDIRYTLQTDGGDLQPTG